MVTITCPIFITDMGMRRTKNVRKIIFATALIIVTSFYFPKMLSWLLLIPVYISIFTLVIFWKDDTAKYIGFLSLKLVLAIPLLLSEENFSLLRHLAERYSYEIIWAVFVSIPELILTLVVIFLFRRLFKNDRKIWVFLLGDIMRWLSLLIVHFLPAPSPNPFFIHNSMFLFSLQ